MSRPVRPPEPRRSMIGLDLSKLLPRDAEEALAKARGPKPKRKGGNTLKRQTDLAWKETGQDPVAKREANRKRSKAAAKSRRRNRGK